MDLKELTQSMNRFVEAKGWYAPGSLRPQTPRNIAISLSLEAAEVLEHFQWSENTADPEEVSGELADVALYLFQLSSVLGIDLEQAVLTKLEKNYSRTWDDPKGAGREDAGHEAADKVKKDHNA
jgi:NTP pyrophosphatase (non-canonical NTP hydrolase)